MKRKLPATSHTANEAASIEMRSGHWSKIIKALKILGLSTGEEIATHLGMDKHQIGRRMIELEGLQIVYKPGSKKNTSSGRAAYQYCLTGTSQPKTEAVEKSLKGKSVADYSKDIHKIKKEVDQPRLF
jgi:predicted transcriptional regulator